MNIDSLKSTLDFLFAGLRLGLTLDKNGDGRLGVAEIFSALTSGVILQLPSIYKSHPDILAEIKDLTPQEMTALANYVSDQDYLPLEHYRIEELIKATLHWLAMNAEYVEFILEKFKETPSE